MKQFYACEPKVEAGISNRKQEWTEYDIDTLIYDEMVSVMECDDSFSDLSDEEFFKIADAKAKETKTQLMIHGIYKNKFGQPLFLYC